MKFGTQINCELNVICLFSSWLAALSNCSKGPLPDSAILAVASCVIVAIGLEQCS